NRDELAIAGPSVLVFAPQIAPRRYVSRFRQRAVGNVSVPGVEGGCPNPFHALVGQWETVRPRVRLHQAAAGGQATADDRTNSAFGLEAGTTASRDASQALCADPATCAAHLLRYLKHHGLLPGSIRDAVSVPGIAPIIGTSPV